MKFLYVRTSSDTQSTQSQLHAMGDGFDRTFIDEGVSGTVLAAKRPQLCRLLDVVRRGDSIHVFDLSRLGRDSIDVQTTVRDLIRRGVDVHVQGLGVLGGEAGGIVVAVLSQVAEMERAKIVQRTAVGRETARASIKATGLTQHGKTSLGSVRKLDPETVIAWRRENEASIAETAKRFRLSTATVKRYCAGRLTAAEKAMREA